VAVVEARPEEAKPPKSVIRIEPSRRWLSLKLRDVWAARELLYFFVWRDVKVRYKQTVLGAAWAVIQPFLTMVVFTLFFGKLAKLSQDVSVPYPIFSYAGLLPWQFFANGLGQSATSLLSQRATITKIYFPRMTVPLAAVLGGLVDFAVAFLVLIGMMIYYGIAFSPKALLIVPLLGIAAMTAFGVGMFLAALNVKYRDVVYVTGFLIQIWLFATPVIYPSHLIHNNLLRTILGLNPMAGVVEVARWALIGTPFPSGPLFLASCGMAVLLLAVGAVFFGRTERTFADVM
jgi:homopolymeric O-antigen transport system permease protein